MSKSEFVDKVAQEAGLSKKDAAAAVDAFSVAPARARDEVAAFVRPLVALGALRWAEPVCSEAALL